MKRRMLRWLLAATGIFFVFGLYPMSRLWPAGFGWSPLHPAFERMMVAMYASLGVFLMLAARAPTRYRPIIDFTIVSSIAHGGVMAIDAARDEHNRLHLFTDVPALLALAVLLMILRSAATEGGCPSAESPSPRDITSA